MARRGLLATILHEMKVAERKRLQAQRTAARKHEAAARNAEKARAAEARALEQEEKAAIRAEQKERKRLTDEAKLAHVSAMEAEAEERNAHLAMISDELENLLTATLDVDDYVDLETLRRTPANHPFERPDLEVIQPIPKAPILPAEPRFRSPSPPKGFFGKRKRHEQAIAVAKQQFENEHNAWNSEVDRLNRIGKAARDAHAKKEAARIAALEHARAEHAKEIEEHNAAIDQLIANLGYGTTEAIEEYLGIVLSNSAYPDCFPCDHEFSFEASNAELSLTVTVPDPSSLSEVKHYKYKKPADEIVETTLSAKACRERYASALHQVALRSLHEVFEADRRGLIRSISLQVGTATTDPATGLHGFRPFVAVAAQRDVFLEFNLAAVTPVATLTHLGAALSKDPYGLVQADVSGMRRS